MRDKALTRLQAVIIAVVVVIIIAAAVSYYMLTLPAPPAPAPPAPPPAPAPPAPAPPAPPPKTSIRIGYVDAFTGIFAPGPYLWGGAWFEILVDEYNAKGGLYIPELGKKLPIELVVYDSKSDIETLIRLTEKAMVEDKVDFMIAPWATSMNFAVYPLYEKHGYPLIAHAFGSAQMYDLIKAGAARWIFPVLCQPPFVAKYTVDFLEWAGAARIGIIGISDLHGIEFTGCLMAELSKRGLSGKVVVGPELYPLAIEDLSPIIKKLKEAKVDALWASTYPADGILLIKQSMELDFCPRIMFMGPGSQYPGIMVPQFGVKVMTGIMEYHGFEVDYRANPKLMEMAEKYKGKVGFYPGANTIASYASYEWLFKAIEKYGLDRGKIRDALARGETFETVVGPTKFDSENVYFDAPGAGYLCQWQDDEILRVVWPLDRATAPWVPKAPWPK